MRKIRANEQEQIKNFARSINANIDEGWQLLTLTYREETVPADYSELEKNGQKIMERIRKKFRQQFGRAPKCFRVDANWSPKRNAPSRFHHHILIEKCDLEMIRQLWTLGGTAHEDIDSRKDHTALAVYLFHNVQHSKAEQGKPVYHPSRGNLTKPIYTEPVEVNDIESIEPLPDSQQTDFDRTEDEDGKTVSTYVRCIVQDKPRLRGRQVIIGKPKGRRQETLNVKEGKT